MNNIIKRVWNQNRMVNIEGLCGMAFQAESGGHTFEISGVDDTGAAVALSGTVTGVFRRPDNADIALTGSASDGVVSVTLTNDCYAVPGRFGLVVYVTSNSQKVAVYSCVGTVASTNGGEVAGDTPQDVVDLINAIAAAVATIPPSYTDLMAAIAPTYSNSALYAVGAYVWYDGNLYRCTTAITTAESWTEAHWTAVNIGDSVNTDIGNLREAIADEYDSTATYPCGSYCRVGGSIYRNWIAINTPESFTGWKWQKISLLDGILVPVSDVVIDKNTMWELGSYDLASGVVQSSSSSVITQPMTNIEEVVGGEYYFCVFVWKNGEYIGMLNSNGTISIPSGSAVVTKYAYLGNYSSDYQFALAQYSTTDTGRSPVIEVRLKKFESAINSLPFGVLGKAMVDGCIKLKSSTSPSAISIASGETGYNRHFEYLFLKGEIDNYLALGEVCTCVLVVKPANYTIDPHKEILMVGPIGENYTPTNVRELYNLNDGTKAFVLRFKRPDTTSLFFALTFQCKNQQTLSSAATITPIGGYLILDKYTEHVTDAYEPYETVITVGTGKQYTSLRTALEYASTIANRKNHVTVQYFGEGVEYDVMDDISASDLTTSSSFIGLVVPAYTKLLGMGSWIQNKISLELPSGTDTDVAFRISTINLYENAELENLWFYGKRCRYACHDDTQTYDPEWKLKTIKNCRFTSDFTNQHRAYGAGYRSGVNWRFENCIFENINGEAEQYGNAAFSAHNNNGIAKTPSITFVNCQFSGGHGVGFESLNRTTGQTYPNAKTNISFYGCKATAGRWSRLILAGIEHTGDVVEVMITGCGNNFNNNDIGVYNSETQTFISDFDDQFTLWGKIVEASN